MSRRTHMLASCVDGLHPPWQAQRPEVLSAPAVTEVSTGHEGVAEAGHLRHAQRYPAREQ